jgi:hypothetical protein
MTLQVLHVGYLATELYVVTSRKVVIEVGLVGSQFNSRMVHMVFVSDKLGLRHFSSTISAFPVSVQSNPDLASLFTAVRGGISKHCSQAFMGGKRLYLILTYHDFHQYELV